MSSQKQYDKLCPECGKRFDPSKDDFILRAVRHFLNEHPDAKLLKEAVVNTLVYVKCVECGRPFKASANANFGGLTRRAFCDDCTEDQPIRRLMAVDLTPEELVSAEVTESNHE